MKTSCPPTGSSCDLVTLRAASQALGVSLHALRHRVRTQGTTPGGREGRTNLYRLEDLKALTPNPEDPNTQEILSLREDLRERDRLIKKLSLEVGNWNRVCHVIAERTPCWPAPKSQALLPDPDKPVADPVLVLSDWHLGDLVNPLETEGLGVFDQNIAHTRIEKLFGGIQKLRSSVAGQYNCETLHVLCLGDFISGDIHPELRETCEFPVTEQAVVAGHLLGQLLWKLSALFPQVVVTAVRSDNHGRLDPKPRYKSKEIRNWNHIVYEIASAHLLNVDNLEVFIPDSMLTMVEIQGWNFLCTHGDIIRAWGGHPHYAINRYLGLEARRRGKSRTPDLPNYDYFVHGHFHTAGWFDDVISNGSLTGITEYDYGCGRRGYPSQVTFLVNPNHGVFNFTPWHLN